MTNVNNVAEMRMLQWMCGDMKLDKIRNERIRGEMKVGEIAKKLQERRLKWYGHVMRREEHYIGRRAMEMKVQGRRKRGRPKRRWLDKVKDDIKERRDCRLMMCMTVLHGGICHRTSTTHQSGNKVKENKKKCVHYLSWRSTSCDCDTHIIDVVILSGFLQDAYNIMTCFSGEVTWSGRPDLMLLPTVNKIRTP